VDCRVATFVVTVPTLLFIVFAVVCTLPTLVFIVFAVLCTLPTLVLIVFAVVCTLPTLVLIVFAVVCTLPTAVLTDVMPEFAEFTPASTEATVPSSDWSEFCMLEMAELMAVRASSVLLTRAESCASCAVWQVTCEIRWLIVVFWPVI